VVTRREEHEFAHSVARGARFAYGLSIECGSHETGIRRMAKARKRRVTRKTKKKARPASAKRRTAKTRTAKRSKAPAARRARRKRKAGVVDTVKGAVETMVEVVQETQAMREKAGTRGGLSEG
jgi:hypothetical protein